MERRVGLPVVARAPEGPGSRAIFEEWMITSDLRVYGKLAQAWARYGARFGDPGDVAEWKRIGACTHMRHGDRWRITSLAYASAED